MCHQIEQTIAVEVGHGPFIQQRSLLDCLNGGGRCVGVDHDRSVVEESEVGRAILIPSDEISGLTKGGSDGRVGEAVRARRPGVAEIQEVNVGESAVWEVAESSEIEVSIVIEIEHGQPIVAIVVAGPAKLGRERLSYTESPIRVSVVGHEPTERRCHEVQVGVAIEVRYDTLEDDVRVHGRTHRARGEYAGHSCRLDRSSEDHRGAGATSEVESVLAALETIDRTVAVEVTQHDFPHDAGGRDRRAVQRVRGRPDCLANPRLEYGRLGPSVRYGDPENRAVGYGEKCARRIPVKSVGDSPNRRSRRREPPHATALSALEFRAGTKCRPGVTRELEADVDGIQVRVGHGEIHGDRSGASDDVPFWTLQAKDDRRGLV